MAKASKILIRLALGAGLLLVLLASGALLLQHVLDSDAFGPRVAAELEAHYHICSQKIKVRVLPFPRLVMYGAKINIPETLVASADTVLIYPKILLLLKGEFTPSEVEILAPDITARLPEKMPEGPADSSSQPPAGLTDRIAHLQAMLIATVPGVTIVVHDGKLKLYKGPNRVFFFDEIDLKSSVHGHRVDFELTNGKSNLWHAFSFGGRVDLGTLKSSGEINLTGGAPQDLLRYLDPAAADWIGDSQIDLKVTFSTGGPDTVRADFTALVPQFTLNDGAQRVVLNNGALRGALHIDARGLDFFVSHFHFDTPNLNLSASYTENFSDHSINLGIDGRENDVASAKSVILTLSKAKPLIRTFEIIREGEVPEIHFRAHANTGSALMKLENITIRGSLRKGVVFAPKADLLVSDVSGDVLVKDGVLTGTHMFGRTAGSSTSDGEMRIGLPREDRSFHLDLPISADISELPDVLNRVVPNRIFRQEIGRIKDVSGKTEGRLLIDQNIDDLSVKVETGPFQLSGHYGRLPQEVEVKGSYFLIEGNKLTVKSMAGKTGNSSFQDVNLTYDWGEAKDLEITAGAGSVISMDLLGPYLRAHEYWKGLLDAAPKGSMAVDSFRFSGPLADPSKFIFNAKGRLEDVVFQSKRVNGPVTLKTGSFELDGDRIILRNANASVADSSLLISADIAGYLDQLKQVDIQLGGQIGPEGNKIAASLARLPRFVRAISELHLQSRLTWDREHKTVFKGEMQLLSGTRMRLSLVDTHDHTSIEDLVIEDEDSNAAISMKFSDDYMDVGFSGTLSNKTADRLLVKNTLLKGPISGKFSARLYPDLPAKSSAQGEVRISGFQVPFSLPVPARIEDAEIQADGNNLNVKSAMISWGGSRLSLTGNITVAEGQYLVDMNAFADTFDLDAILNRDNSPEHKDDSDQVALKSTPEAWQTPVKGIIRVKSEHLSYGKVSWNPAQADVTLGSGLIEIRLKDANLCGISTPGDIRITPEGVSVSLDLSAKDQDLESCLSCLLNKKHFVSGSYSLTGNISSKGGEDNFANSLEGSVDFKAKDGRIFRFELLSKIISLLSISEIYRGVLPDLLGEGCFYTSIDAKGKIQNGKLVLSDSVVNGPCVKMVFRGDIDLARQKVDVVALVAPLRTVERVVDATPVMGKVFDEAFVTLPVRISGDLSDPAVVLLSPSAVGEELFGVMKRIFKLPLVIFQPRAEKGSATP